MFVMPAISGAWWSPPCAWKLFLADAGESEVRELTWLHPLSPWFVFLVLLPAALAFAFFIYRRENMPARTSGAAAEEGAGTPPRRSALRWSMALLRAAVLLALAALLCLPVLRTTKYKSIDSTILLLVDDSLSMDVADKFSNRDLVQKTAEFLRSTPENIESTSRYDLIRRLFRDEDVAFLERLRQKGKVAVYSFAAGPRRLKELSRAKPGDPPLSAEEREVFPPYEKVRAEERVQETRVSDALIDALSSERGSRFGAGGERVSGIILFSDGQQTPGARPIEEIAMRLGQRGVPIHAIGIGNPDEPKDIRVTGLDVSDIVLSGDLVAFDAGLVADGFEGERVRVDLKLDGEVVATDYVLLEGKGQRQSFRLNYRPQREGDFVATVEVERRSGELFVENNAFSKPIKVLDQKIKVLYADGPPRWEYRYLKNALIRDPTMEAQVFLFSAEANFIQESSPGVPSLSLFPQKRDEIFSYHVIVLGDVDVSRDLRAEQVALLKEFVFEAGGGIVFVAGSNSNPMKYLHSDLYAVLPVEVPESDAVSSILETAPITDAFNVELTPVGKEHAVMRLDNDPALNIKLWESPDGKVQDHLPGFYWFAQVGRPKKGAVVLARHPSKIHPLDQRGYTIFAFMNYGKGRTFFSAVDNTWRWRAGVDNQYFYRFWGQVIRFCATGRLLGKTPRFSISTDKESYALGENVVIDAKVFDANMQPSKETSLTVYHQARGAQVEVPEKVELAQDQVEGQGSYRGGLVANRIGLHDLWMGTEEERLAFRTFKVVVPALELRDPRRNQALLEETARLSGGTCLDFSEAPAVLEKLKGESQAQQGDVEDDPVWDDVWILLAFVGLISLEWILRKVANLL